MCEGKPLTSPVTVHTHMSVIMSLKKLKFGKPTNGSLRHQIRGVQVGQSSTDLSPDDVLVSKNWASSCSVNVYDF